VLAHLKADATAITLPGQGDGFADATLDDQVDAVVRAIDAVEGPVLLVGHSAASSLAWLGADRRTDKVAKVALIGGMPAQDGQAYAGFFEPVDGVVAFPGWEPFEGPDSEDLTEQQKAQIAADAHPVPAAVTQGVVRLADERRYDIPVVMICPEFSPEDAKAWVEAGEIPEIAKAGDVSYVDIDSGHWPMWSKPAELAAILDELT
jgi:pimeloyl-ACP methyl ester carboxylesterase